MPVNLQITKPYPDFEGCEQCGSYHAFLNEKCPVCNLCFSYCVRDVGCKWYNGNDIPVTAPAPADQIATTGTQKAQVVANQNTQEAFECWLASSTNVTLHVDVEDLYKEFEAFLKEILTPVDSKRSYFALEEKGDGDIKFRKLDSTKLHTNQEGVYVIVDGRKRTRIGTNVAVM